MNDLETPSHYNSTYRCFMFLSQWSSNFLSTFKDVAPTSFTRTTSDDHLMMTSQGGLASSSSGRHDFDDRMQDLDMSKLSLTTA